MADNLNEQDIRKIAEAAEAFQRLANELNPVTEKSKELAEQAAKNAKAFKVFGKEMSDAGASLRKAALNVSDTTGKYAEGVEGATNAVSNLASNFGFLGKTVGFLVNIFGKLAGGALKQNENLVKSYRALSQVGDLNSDFKKFGDQIRDAGFSVDQNSDAYVKSITKIAPSLATFSGTLTEGKEKLQAVFEGSLGDAQKQLERFGYSTEEAFERTGFYMSQLAASGGASKKTNEELNKSSRLYMETLVGLSQLTGQQRDELEAKMRSDQTDLRFQIHQRKLREADLGHEADNLAGIMAVLPEELREGAKSMIVNQGRIVDDAAAQFYQAVGNKGFAGILNASKQKVEDFPVVMAETSKDLAKILRGRFKTFDEVLKTGNDAGKDFALGIGTYAFMNRSDLTDVEKINKLMATIRNKNMKNDMDANTDRIKKERQMRNAFEQLEFEISKIMIPALNLFTDTLTSIGAKFADILYSIGGPDIRGAFITFSKLEDVTSELNKQQEIQVKLNKERTETEKELNALLDKQAESAELERKGGLWAQGNKKKPQEYERDIANIRAKLNNINLDLRTSKGVESKARTAGSELTQTVPQAETQTGESGSLAGLKIKKGDVQKEGAYIDPKLIEMAKIIQSKIPGFNYFSSFNDNFHQGMNSQHNKGKALDFVLDHWPTVEEGNKIIETLKGMGAANVFDEYNFPSKKSSGNHIHAELQGKTQGIFKGPESGYWLKAHGEEALLNKQGLSSLVTKMQMPNMGGATSDLAKVLQDGIDALISEVSDLVELQRANNRTQDELLTYTKN